MTASPRLLLTESARTAMTTAAARAHPYETGGILVGVQADGQPWVTAAIEIDSGDSGRNHYWIPAGATHAAVMSARATDHRLGYLGDWHTHPADLGPSTTDLTTLAVISPTHPRRANPTQIVVRRTPTGYALDARRVVRCAPRVCGVTLTGDLPPRSLSTRHGQTAVANPPPFDRIVDDYK